MEKKLLILGGNRLSCDIVAAAKSLGVYTIVTDWYDTDRSPAKLLCDERWDVSTTDYEELVRRIKEYHVDGVLTGFSDSYLLPYQHLCELVGLPCYASKEQFEWTLNKKAFKEKCRKYGVPVVPEFALDDFDKSIISKSHKVIIKPVDNSGSRGICVCDTPDEFDEKLKFSLEFSEKKSVVIERYMECDDVSFEYKIQDGEMTLTAICDRDIYKTQNEGSITSKLVYPSKYTEAYLNGVDKSVRRMFEVEGFRNGVLFMQAFADADNFYFYEMGYRLSGGRHYIFTKHQNDDSAVEDLVRFAVTGKMSDRRISEFTTPCFKNVCSQLSVICKSERIAKIKGWKDIIALPQVIDALQTYEEGDEVGKQGTTASIFARLHIVVTDNKELEQVIDRVYSILKVRNKEGENLVIRCS